VPEPPDVTKHQAELRLTDDLKVVELIEILEHVLWWRDNLCTPVRLDRGVHTFILRALKQR
jgi:hypothetical protein